MGTSEKLAYYAFPMLTRRLFILPFNSRVCLGTLISVLTLLWQLATRASNTRGWYSQTKKCTTFMLLSIFLKWFCQMLFGQYRVKFFPNITGKLRFLRYQEKIRLHTYCLKSIWQNKYAQKYAQQHEGRAFFGSGVQICKAIQILLHNRYLSVTVMKTMCMFYQVICVFKKLMPRLEELICIEDLSYSNHAWNHIKNDLKILLIRIRRIRILLINAYK